MPTPTTRHTKVTVAETFGFKISPVSTYFTKFVIGGSVRAAAAVPPAGAIPAAAAATPAIDFVTRSDAAASPAIDFVTRSEQRQRQ